MENKKRLNFFLLIIALIVGAALFKQFDFKTLRAEKPALAIVYAITFVFSIYFLVKDFRKREEK
jgi:uncharacterized membrane protein (UPF0136 family)